MNIKRCLPLFDHHRHGLFLNGATCLIIYLRHVVAVSQRWISDYIYMTSTFLSPRPVTSQSDRLTTQWLTRECEEVIIINTKVGVSVGNQLLH